MVWPPPPNGLANAATSTLPTERSDTFTRPWRNLAEQERHPDPFDRAGELDHAVEVVGGDAQPLDRAGRHRDPGEPDSGSTTSVCSASAKQPGPSLGGAGIDLEIDLLGIDPGLEQLGGDPQGPGPGVAEAEAAGIGQDARRRGRAPRAW